MHKLIMGEGIYIHKDGNNRNNRKENLLPARGAHNNGKTILNGYIAIYMPEHHRSFDNGCVYEHIIVAEKILGRKLFPDECVHHKDKNRKNNLETNLMIFATEEDHISFHGGGFPVLQENGSYKTISKYDYYIKYNNQKIDENNKDSITIKWRIRHKNICPVCNIELKSISAKMCLKCRNIEKAKNIPSKEELEKLIYDISFSEIGRMYGGVDANSVKKWCKKYNLPYRKKDMKTN